MAAPLLVLGCAVRYQVVFEGRASVDLDGWNVSDADWLEALLDRTMEELLRLGAEDASVGGALARGSFDMSMTVEADTPQQAIEVGSGLIRSAMHAAGGFTPDWSPDWIAARAARIAESAEASV